MFFPTGGAIVFQDAFLGVWPITTALIRLGVTPLATLNLLIIASFALSAFAAYLLCAKVSNDRWAAFAGGIVYGFAIFRVAHLGHLHVLLTFWLPLVFLCLHTYLASKRSRWLLLGSMCWAMQGLTSGYFLVYGTVLIGFWALFFFRGQVVEYAKLLGALVLGLIAMWPVLGLYRQVHASFGFRRGISEAEGYSADVVSIFHAPPVLAVWGRLLGGDDNEHQLFPGLILSVVVVAGVAASSYWAGRRWSRVATVCVGLAAMFALASVTAPQPYRLMGGLWLSLLAAVATSPPVQRVVAARSVAGFYAFAALGLWILALGPTVRLLGHRIWYHAPYWWFAMLPGADAVRVPARLWLVVMLALAVVATHVLAKLRVRRPGMARPVVVAVCAFMLIEAWPGQIRLPAPPDRFTTLENPSDHRPVLELPIDAATNYAAMYRGMFHGRPLINGESGYAPASFLFLMSGLKNGEAGVLRVFAERTSFQVVVHKSAADAARLSSLVEEAGGVKKDENAAFTLYEVAQAPASPDSPAPPPVTIRRVTHSVQGDITRILTDDDASTFVEPGTLAIALERACRIEEVQLAVRPGLGRVEVFGNDPARRGEAVPADLLWTGAIADPGVRAAFLSERDPGFA
jgi:hypothetical protein